MYCCETAHIIGSLHPRACNCDNSPVFGSNSIPPTSIRCTLLGIPGAGGHPPQAWPLPGTSGVAPQTGSTEILCNLATPLPVSQGTLC